MSSVKQKAIPIILTGAFITCGGNYFLLMNQSDWYSLGYAVNLWVWVLLLISYATFFYQQKKMNQGMDSNNEEIPNNKYPVLLLSFLISFTSIGLYKESATHLLNLLNINAASSQIIPLSLGPFIFFFLCYFLLSLFVKIFDKKARVLYIYGIGALFALGKILAILYSLL